MRRRKYLKTIAAGTTVAALAGCTSDGDEGGNGNGNGNGNENGTGNGNGRGNGR
jgi:hypothetical protein